MSIEQCKYSQEKYRPAASLLNPKPWCGIPSRARSRGKQASFPKEQKLRRHSFLGANLRLTLSAQCFLKFTDIIWFHPHRNPVRKLLLSHNQREHRHPENRTNSPRVKKLEGGIDEKCSLSPNLCSFCSHKAPFRAFWFHRIRITISLIWNKPLQNPQ